MDPRGPAPQSFQKAEKPGRVRRRKTRRERNKALLGSRQQLAHQDSSVASRNSPMDLQHPAASTAPKFMVITQGRLSREHWGLFNHEVKSLDVARLLSNGSLEPGTPTLPTKTAPSPGRAHKPAPQTRGKENQAFPRRNLVQEARDAIVGTLQACHGCVPDLTLVLRDCQPPLSGIKPGDPERRRINIPEQAPEEGRQRRRWGTKEFAFAMPDTSNTPTAHRESLAPKGPWPLTLPSLPSPSAVAWGPPTAFDLLKSIWLVATPPTSQSCGVRPPQPLPQPPSHLLPQTSALDWSPSPSVPQHSLSWTVAQSSPESWSFPPMRLY
ncbi:proline-rich protein 19 isoform X2 [Saccopteryx leptura]|uniref:proline-rich protein 19 isoform X2 n=1 Tax=Saccopteryx leptura TaxID=249018 RepID=UPI00339B9F6B